MKKTLFIILIMIPFLVNASGNGGYAGAAFRIGLGARSIALGNAGVADKTTGYSFYYNPALTAFTKSKTVSLSASSMSLDRFSNYIGFSMDAPPVAGMTIGWLRSGVGELYRINSIGEIGDEMDHSINAAYFNFALHFSEKVAIGLSMKHMWESIDLTSEEYYSSGWGWEFGVLYNFNEKISFGAVVRDIASQLSANTGSLYDLGGTTHDDLPFVYVVGARYITPYEWLRVLYDFESSDKDNVVNHLGAEALYKNIVALRMGYETHNEGNRFTAGLGIDFKEIKQTKGSLLNYLGQLDYVFYPGIVGEGSSHIFSWQIYIN